MEYVPCGDLQGYLQNNGVLPEHLAKTMARQIFESMAYLHQKKITHRDIKPDNILIACEDPFSVKLSDFGLSKVVKNEETFLKTFCGTLLYCAPEVFPHYEAHIASKGTKRRRCSNTPQTKFHSYSQSVDIWSFAAVLWFSLCNKPPFEGVADNTGRGMFDKIMRTPLDTTPLQQLGISANAIDLLVAMLNTDPSLRPSEVQCLQHPWLADVSVPREMEFETDLDAIPEEDEDEEEEIELDVSHLSIHDGARQSEVRDSDEASFDSGDFGSGDFDYFDPRQFKRVKASPSNPRDQAAMESSPEVSYHPTPFLHRTETRLVGVSQRPQPNRLFGEIGQSAFQSSGVFGARTNYALTTSNRDLRDPSTSADTSARDTDEPYSIANTSLVNDMPEQYHDQHQNISDHPVEGATGQTTGDGAMAANSLLGAESLVRELNMESPRSANSPAAEPDEPRTPRTPEPPQNPPIGQADGGAEEQHNHPEDITPKQPVFNRSLPLPSSFYYNTNDRNMHNLEYATKISDNDFITAPELATSDHPSLPATTNASASPPNRSSDDTTNSPEAPSEDAIASPPPSQFLRPPPRLGKLTSTADSFTPITLKLEERITSWGRDPANTLIFPDRLNTRVPKRGICLWFYAKGIERAEAEGRDWTKMDGLHTIVSTESSLGIRVNGVKLKKGVDGTLYGRVYTGDEVTVFDGPAGRCLKFTCEFFHGEAAKRRAKGGPRFEVMMEDKQRRRSMPKVGDQA
ncbi:hypothetical protein LTR04_001615 [Oleoguttula sp. CCFEE 6159]|nr:hypothetical protein LTR04_001615 [Oleoguttula sp. CCFEE 6159]